MRVLGSGSPGPGVNHDQMMDAMVCRQGGRPSAPPPLCTHHNRPIYNG